MNKHPETLRTSRSIGTPSRIRSALLGCTAVLSLTLLAHLAHGQGSQGTNRWVVRYPWPGGLNPAPVITSISNSGGINLQWLGLKGPYQVQKADGVGAPWANLGSAVTDKFTTVPLDGELGLLQVTGAIPRYAGAQTCATCHVGTHENWSQTRHARAFETLRNIGQHENNNCISCHSVGHGLQGGFVNEATTPGLVGVQCENCHGPAGDHAAKPLDLGLRPVVSPSAAVCGGCHNGFHHPTYDEWNTAGHGHVTPSVANYFRSADGEARMKSCGACHSGASRLAMLTGNPLPPGNEAAVVSVTCATCHSGHGNTGNARQLRNPTFSTNYFSYNTSTNTDFARQYNADVNMCGQCHNMRGALPTDSSRPPHHSPQYNILTGQVTAESDPLWAAQGSKQIRSSHTMIQAQCAHCHTHAHPVDNPTEENPNYTGHAFEPHVANCADCHEPEMAEAMKGLVQSEIKALIQRLKGRLDQWGETKAPEALRVKYGALAWEYTTAGQLSNPTGSSAIKGPSATEQPSLPQTVKDARFNLYLVEHDGSYGVHNGKYARFLLKSAETNVVKLLNAP